MSIRFPMVPSIRRSSAGDRAPGIFDTRREHGSGIAELNSGLGSGRAVCACSSAMRPVHVDHSAMTSREVIAGCFYRLMRASARTEPVAVLRERRGTSQHCATSLFTVGKVVGPLIRTDEGRRHRVFGSARAVFSCKSSPCRPPAARDAVGRRSPKRAQRAGDGRQGGPQAGLRTRSRRPEAPPPTPNSEEPFNPFPDLTL